MTISANYATPVTVNGFVCRNCTDVDYAKKQIDPAHPRSGPYGIDARDDPTQPQAVQFGGSLSALNDAAQRRQSEPNIDGTEPGSTLDLTA